MEVNTEVYIDPYEYKEDERMLYRDSTYEIVSKVAYLFGIPLRIFENEYEPPRLDIYRQLDADKTARVVRNLCMLRAAIVRWFKRIQEQLEKEYKSIYSVPEYMPQIALDQLAFDGNKIPKATSRDLTQVLIEINRIICDRINNCESLFPIWLNWEYIRDLFIMRNGLTTKGVKTAREHYLENIQCYPYGVFINWKPYQCGNLLYNDKKFVKFLYQNHKTVFSDISKVSDVGEYVKRSIYQFIGNAQNLIMVVDCENSDPYRLCATLKGLEPDRLEKIQKIVLLDDVHTVKAWRILERCCTVPVEHIMTQRIKERKSLVDIEMTALTCREHYRNHVDSFIIVSSDSDYWGLISSLPEAKFLVMIEREKCSTEMKATLANNGIFYCYIEDFFDGNGEEFKKLALFNEIYSILENSLHLNVNEMFQQALLATRIQMKPAERRQFFEKHINNMKLVIKENGDAAIELNTK